MTPAVALAVLLRLAAAPTPDEPASDPVGSEDADAALARAVEAYDAGAYAEAATAFGEAYERAPSWGVAFSWGHAERHAGDCTRALQLYALVVADAGAPSNAEELVAPYVRECNAALEPAPPEPAPPVAVPPPRVEPDTTPRPRPLPPRPRRDVAAGVLLGGGAAFVVAGAALFAAASVTDSRAEDRSTHHDFERSLRVARTEQYVGIAAFSVGGALILAAAIRYAILVRRYRALKARTPAP